jgi:high-affinity nickel-transport protein
MSMSGVPDGQVKSQLRHMWGPMAMAVLLIQCVAWAAGLWTASGRLPVLALCAMAYVLGLRHALDADHIAAIDSVIRGQVGRAQRAQPVGLLFALGHSCAVTIISLVLSVGAVRTSIRFEQFMQWSSFYATLVSIAILILLVPRNAMTAYRIGKAFLCKQSGAIHDHRAHGVIVRLLRPLLSLQLRSWQLFLMGALFGLGFETGTAIAVMAISAAQAAGGVPLVSAMVFPLLFAAGMTLVDALDGLFMQHAYGRALARPELHTVYNLIVTSLSASIALLVGLIELLSLVRSYQGPGMPGAAVLTFADGHFEELGSSIICLFVLGWAASVAITRLTGRRSVQENLS